MWGILPQRGRGEGLLGVELFVAYCKCIMASDSNSPILLVITGFGPYRNYIINSSWEAVKELAKLSLGGNVQLKILELPVKYSEVEKRIAELWLDSRPLLSVHVGMMSSSKVIALEQCGRNKGYMENDLSGAHPQGGCCLLEGPERIESAVNMKRVCKNISWPGVHVIHSRDAGRYLCEYAYYISLFCGSGKAVFIHVPTLSRIITPGLLGQALQIIIQEMLRQLSLCGR
ncbi:pyroglutamyl-peptidase 1-like protein [Dendropsophus ebraccatus]|uniref:pyroglutamyl-peptidase 1-like protein n=1 Tax=Dendropsophus ebraccatus TaxID=150705 RepID=UPI003831B972